MLLKDYVYTVVSYLPAKMRKDVSEDLEAHLKDQLGQEPYVDEHVEKVIRKMGNPKKVAEAYLERPRALIGPRWIDHYYLVLKIVLLVSIIGVLVAKVVGTMDMAWTMQALIQYSIQMFASVLGVFISGLGYVTLIFMALEHFVPEDEIFDSKDEEWALKDLKPYKEDVNKVSISEMLSGIIFSTLAIVWAQQWNMSLMYASDVGWIPFLSEAHVSTLKWVVTGYFSLVILFNFFIMAQGVWKTPTRLSSIVLDALGLGIFLAIMFNSRLWDMEAVYASYEWTESMRTLFNWSGRVLVVGVSFAFLYSIGEQVWAFVKNKHKA